MIQIVAPKQPRTLATMAPMQNTFLRSMHDAAEHAHHGNSKTSIAHAILASPEVIQATPPAILPALCEMLSINPDSIKSVMDAGSAEAAKVHQAA